MSKKTTIDVDAIFERYHFLGDPSNKNDVYTFMMKETSNGMLKKENVFKACFPILYSDIRKTDWDASWSFSQILSHYFDPHIITTCRTCGGAVPYRSFKKGYAPYCSTKCANSNDDKKLKTENTNISRYGVKNVFMSETVKEQSKKTCNEKYGHDYASQSKDVRDKITDTCTERYGCSTPFRMDDFQEKSRKTCITKYGCDYPSQAQVSKEKARKTCNEKYGASNPSYSPDVIEKRRVTNFSKYNDKWITQTEDFISANHNKFLERHPDIINETKEAYIVRCNDECCDLCHDKCFEIDKETYKQRSSSNIILCPIKNPVEGTSSYVENEIADYIRTIYDGEIITSDRSLIAPKEIDIYIPEKKLAIEFNGVFWHSDFNPKMHKNYHRDKSLECMAKGVHLLHIWEDDWNLKKNIIKDYIRSKLGLCSKRVYARKCRICEINAHIARDFMEANHIQGYANSTYKIALYYNNEIVSVMLIGKLRNSMGSVPKEGSYEIYRLASSADTEVCGGFSKMLAYFEKKYTPKEIITYGDLCYTWGNVYKKCGFIEERLSSPCYSWVVGRRRYHRSNFMKSKLKECREDDSLTEDNVMRSRGAYKIWDAGKIRFVKHYNISE